jgi:hypothetical protein
MSATSGIRTGDWLARIVLARALALAGACGVSCLSPLSDGVLTGTVMLGAPVSGAEVRVWRLHLDGQRRDREPIAEATTDAAGRFRVELGAAFGNLLVEATGGQARELWAAEPIDLDRGSNAGSMPGDRLVAVLPLYVPVAEREIVVSPFTTVAAALAERRLVAGEESVYHEAMQRAQAMLGEHLGRIDITDTPVHPIGEPASQLTARVRHGLVLGALSLLAGRMADAAGASVRSINTMVLTRALVADASTETPLLDGIGPEGPIELGQCQPRPDCPDCRPLCRLSADTLRIDLAETLAFHLVGSMVDGTGLLFGDVASLADDIAAGVEPLLFGDVAPGAIRDDQGPLILSLMSPFFDEDSAVVDFDTMLQPVRVHLDAARLDLASLSMGDCTRALHKHVDGLRAPDDNPLRWRFAVSDNAAGFEPQDIQVNIRPASTLTPHPLDVVPLDAPGSGYAPGSVFEVVALADAVPALAEVEGRFDIEISAVDRLGNPGPVLRGCWQHVPRAAPLYATQAQIVLGPGSADSVDLDNDEIHRLLGERLEPSFAYPFVRIPVQNNTDEVVYLTPAIDELIGTYDRTWIAARAFLRADASPDNCLTTNPPTCSMELPRDPRLEDTVENQSLPGPADPDAFVTLRVIDTAGGFVDACSECRPGEFRLAPRRAYELQAVVTTFDFLVPEGIDTGRITRIAVGPTGDRVQLTGFVDESGFNRCSAQNPAGDCTDHEFFALYQALTAAHIDIQSVRISARTAPTATLPPRVPRPARSANVSTFSSPVSTSYAWSTTEERIPVEGGN